MVINSWLTGRRMVCLPFSDHCTPLIKDEIESSEIFESILNYCKSKKIKFIEFKSLSQNFPPNVSVFRKDFIHKLKIDLPDNELFKSFSDNTKRNIKKATKEGVELIIKNDERGMIEFYKMNCVTRQKHGLPPQPYAFFNSILKNIINVGSGDILFATKDNDNIAGAIYLKFGKKLLYKFGASYSEFFELRGNNFVMWEAIKKYSSEGFEEFDFGKTEIENAGLRRFKLGWNTEELQIYTTRYDINNNKFLEASTKTRGIHNSIFNHSPIFILKFIGNLLYKHIG
jgi:hypothetical protein